MKEGSITIAVSTWSNNGRGPWRSRQVTFPLREYEAQKVNVDEVILALADKIKNSDIGITSDDLD